MNAPGDHEMNQGKTPPIMTVDDIKKALDHEITHVLLDMDGTLLDKYFDDYFWAHLVPECYAQKNNMPVEQARQYLYAKYKHHEGTLLWTDLDFWSSELDLDIPALKEQIRHLIAVHPHVEDFLTLMRAQGKQVIMATNAHYKSIDLKMKETALGKYFHHIITSLDMGYPKEERGYWEKAAEVTGFQKDRTLFIDDTVEVVQSARLYGIKYLLVKNKPNSHTAADTECPVLSIDHFDELLPLKKKE